MHELPRKSRPAILRRRSISRDLTVSLALGVLLAALVLALYVYQWQARGAMRDLESRADEAIAKAADVLSLPLWNLDTIGVRMVGLAFVQNEEVEAVRIVDAQGRVLFEQNKSRGGEAIHRTREVRYNDLTLGRAEIAYTLDSYTRQMQSLLWGLLAGLLVTFCVVLAATGVLLRVFLRKPLEGLVQGARRVARGDYRGAPEVEHAELEEIAAHFGAMSEAVAQRESELRRVNLELRSAERKYHSIFENAIEGIFQTSEDGVCLSANPSLARILGYDSPDELIALPCLAYRDPEDRKLLLAQLRAQGRVAAQEVQVLRRDGTPIWASVSAQLIRDPEGRVRHIEGSLVDVTVRKKMEDELRHQALHDPLTGLANRVLCTDRIWRALERGKRREQYQFCVLFVDLDRFKVINDCLGHRFGDRLLMEIARRLRECVRDLDTVSRFGGDEFIVLLEELESPRTAMRVVKRIRQSMRTPFACDGHEVRVSASIGIALGSGAGQSPEELIQRANVAMHRSKESGRDRFKVFTPGMLDRAALRLTLENDMERAMREGEFFLEYQPIVSVDGAPRLYALEALARWRHPERGLLPPGEFIPVAEDSGQIAALGLWVLREACRTFALWRQTVPGGRDVLLSVNVSGRQFAQADLVARVLDVLDEAGLPPDRLKLEITETAIMQNAEMAIDKLAALRARGVRISVDDFGTGYSSMSYLQRLPLDTLKIDLSFVRGMDESVENREIVRAIINLAHSLGLEVIAEGVERARHQQALEELRCEYFQGYYYSRPLDAAGVAGFLARLAREACAAPAAPSN
ncbi:putative bifunctional diguanylate cyclase/phosphodiesterase [Desulfocurvus vexinensis]|uniref:putative bifunctional diguanylate cyclase/phosphodiesterase n=1 Tax=Desulfocurvus vexinensis TaxID=399548 RepID=UPI0004BBA91B|nr:EAL domain-containing protein [Desulfocurvus vexinensis]